MELDPMFIRALRLLHSKSKDSVHQLKSMLDESIRSKRGSATTTLPSGSGPANATTAKDSEKRNFEKLKRDLSELVDNAPNSKKPRIHHSPQSFSKSHSPSPTPTVTPPTDAAVVGERVSGGNSSAEEVDLDMNLEGLNDLSCCICKSWNQGNGNKLMECHTCQNLYHQECHAPPISNEEAGDPRLVWNCSQCKSLTAAPASAVAGSSGSLKQTIKLGSMRAGSRSGSSGQQPPSAVFKRSDPGKQSHGGGGPSSGGKPAGMAALAASLKGSSSKGSSRSTNMGSHKTTNSSSGSTSSSSNAIMSADKRLQIMKKKAAQRKK